MQFLQLAVEPLEEVCLIFVFTFFLDCSCFSPNPGFASVGLIAGGGGNVLMPSGPKSPELVVLSCVWVG